MKIVKRKVTEENIEVTIYEADEDFRVIAKDLDVNEMLGVTFYPKHKFADTKEAEKYFEKF